MNKYMNKAILEAYNGINNNHGGPFGCVIVKDNKIVGKGHNKVLLKKDPTCHGEMEAIHQACRKLKTYDLKGCILYTTGEPCNMCLTAIMWANIEKVYYGCSIKDNASIGFRDEKFDNIFNGREKLNDFLECIDRDKCLELFADFNKKDKTIY